MKRFLLPRMNGGGSLRTEVRDRLALALDVDDLVAASRLARSLAGHFRVAKIGLELYTAAGPEAIGAMIDLGYDVFCDLKLHDIPNTVNQGGPSCGGVGRLVPHRARLGRGRDAAGRCGRSGRRGNPPCRRAGRHRVDQRG